MKKIITGSLALAILLMFSGCGNETPKCSDVQTVKLINNIYDKQMSYMKQIMKSSGNKASSLMITLDDTTIRTISEDDKTGMYTCQGTIITNYGKDTNMDKNFINIMKKTLERTITYTVVMSDDGKKFFVNIIK